MSNNVISAITSLPTEELSPIATQVLGEDAVPVGSLSLTKIGRSAGLATAGIFRVEGQAKTPTAERTWSAVVKALGQPENRTSSADQRALQEVDVYLSGAFAHLCGGVRAPHHYAHHKRNDLQLLWLEDLSQAPQPPWDRKHFIDTAYNLGRFNAHWPEQALPQWEWLDRSGFRSSFRKPGYEQVFKRFPMQQDHPFVKRFASPEVARELIEMCDTIDSFLAPVEGTAKGVCHLDCHPKNLFPMQDSIGGSYAIALDWVAVGISSFGIDIGHLTASPITWLELVPDETLVDSISNAYISGLTEAGWSGDKERVRLTYLTRLACEAIRNISLVSHAVDDDAWRKVLEKLIGYPVEEVCTRWGKTLEFYFACKEEALQLAKQV